MRKLRNIKWFSSPIKLHKVSCSTLCDLMDYTVPGILQARILERVAFPFSRGSFQPRDWTQVFRIAGTFFTSWATREVLKLHSSVQFSHSVVSDSLWPHELQHARPPCPSPTPGVYSNSRLKSVMPFSHLILCHPLLLLPPIPPSIRVFSNESALLMRWPENWSFSFSISPSNEHPGWISFRMDWLDILAKLRNYSIKENIFLDLCSSYFLTSLYFLCEIMLKEGDSFLKILVKIKTWQYHDTSSNLGNHI